MIEIPTIEVVVEQDQKHDFFEMLRQQGWYWVYYSVNPVGDDLRLIIGVWADD